MKIPNYRTLVNALPTIVIVVSCLILAFQLTKALMVTPLITLTWDWPGHLDKAKKLDWPWNYGWDSTFWGGQTTLLYPILSHTVVRIFLSLFRDDHATAVVVVLLSVLAEVVGMNKLVNKIVPAKPRLRAVGFLLFIALFYKIGGDQLGGFEANVGTGSFSAAMAIALLLFYLSSSNTYVKTLLFGLLILTHSLTALFVGLFLTIEFVVQLTKKLRHKEVDLKNLFIQLLGGMSIGSPWWLAMIDPAFKSTAINLYGSPQYLIYAILVGLLVLAIELRHKFNVYWIGLVVAVILSTLPRPFITWLQFHGFNGIHFYRFYFSAMIMLVVCLLGLANSHLKKDLHLKSFILLTIIAGALICFPLIRPQTAKIELDPKALSQISGRTLDVSSAQYTDPFPRAPEHLLAELPERPGSAGLFYESSQTGLQFYTLAKTINPDYFANGTLSSFFSDYATRSAQVNPLSMAQLLGVSNISYIAPGDVIDIINVPIATIGAINRYDSDGNLAYSIPWRVAQMKQAMLIEPLTKLPEINPDIDLGRWWLDTDRNQLTMKQNYSNPINSSILPGRISNVVIEPMRIKFYVDAQKPVPVFLKFTYNKYWENVSNPNETPQWITPGYMTLMAQGNTELMWKPPQYILLGYIASVLAIVFISQKLIVKHH